MPIANLTRLSRVRKAATRPQPNSNRLDVWEDGVEYDVGAGSAHEAIRNDDLVQVLRHEPRLCCMLAEMLDPNSSHLALWRVEENLHLN